MIQGHNHYPNIMADAYTIMCKYIHESTKNKNESTTMYDRPATGVSFYQCATPVDGPPVEETDGITEDIITCCKYGFLNQPNIHCMLVWSVTSL